MRTDAGVVRRGGKAAQGVLLACTCVVFAATMAGLLLHGKDAVPNNGEAAAPEQADGPPCPFVLLAPDSDNGQTAAGLLRTVRTNLGPDENFTDKYLVAAPWGTLYLWRINRYSLPRHHFDAYKPGADYPAGDPSTVAQWDNGGKGMDGNLLLQFSNTAPRAYILSRRLAAVADEYSGCAVLWDIAGNQQLDRWCGETDYVKDLILSPDEALAGVHYYWMGNPAGAGITLEKAGKPHAWFGTFRTHMGPWAFNHDASVMFVSTTDGINCLARLPVPSGESDAASPSSEEAPVVFRDEEWETSRLKGSEGTQLTRLSTEFQGGVVHALFTPDDSLLVLADSAGAFQRFDGHTGKALGPSTPLGAPIAGLQSSSTGARLLARTDSGDVHVINMSMANAKALVLHHGPVLTGMRQWGGGNILLTWGGPLFRAWNLNTGLEIFPPIKFSEPIEDAHFPTDFPGIAVSWGKQGTARVCDIGTGTPLIEELRHGQELAGVTLCGDCLLTWDRHGTIREWEVQLPEPQDYRIDNAHDQEKIQ